LDHFCEGTSQLFHPWRVPILFWWDSGYGICGVRGYGICYFHDTQV